MPTYKTGDTLVCTTTTPEGHLVEGETVKVVAMDDGAPVVEFPPTDTEAGRNMRIPPELEGHFKKVGR